MVRCEFCGRIFWLGIKDQGHNFCTKNCHQNAKALALSDRLPAADIDREMQRFHQGDCPRCHRAGPVDVHYSYWVFSSAVITRWATHRHICCQSCGRKSKWRDLLISLVAGWWAFPGGLVMTPIQLVRNLHSLMSPPAPNRPSPNLRQATQIMMGMNLLDSNPVVEFANLPFGTDRQSPDKAKQDNRYVLYQGGVVLRWLLVVISVIFLLFSLEFTQLTPDPMGFSLMGIVVLLPLVDRWVTSQSPLPIRWFQWPWTRVILWLILFGIAIDKLPVFLDAKLCLQTPQPTCSTHVTEVPQGTQKLYVSMKPEKIPDDQNLKFEIQRLAPNENTTETKPQESLFTTTTKPPRHHDQIVMELHPPKLSIGDYQVTVRVEKAKTAATHLKFKVVGNSPKKSPVVF